MENILLGNVPSFPFDDIQNEKSEEQRTHEQDSIAQAYVVGTIPGWDKVRESMLEDVNHLRTHQNTAVYSGDKSDADIGKIFRHEIILAEWIEKYVNRVDRYVIAANELTRQESKPSELKTEAQNVGA